MVVEANTAFDAVVVTVANGPPPPPPVARFLFIAIFWNELNEINDM
jgi:hypothetical protein